MNDDDALRANPAYVPVKLDEDAVEFRAGPASTEQRYSFRDADEDGVVGPVVDALTEARTVGSVLDRVDPGDREDARALLAAFVERGLVHVVEDEAAGKPGGDQGRDRDALRGYLSLSHDDPGERAARLRDARLVVVSDGRVGGMVADELAEMGAGPVEFVADDGVPDRLAGVDAVVGHPESALDDLLPDADFLAYGATAARPELLHRINDLAHEHGVPWVPGRVLGTDGFVGPTVVPGESACYRCFHRRLLANGEDVAGTLAYERAVESSGPAAHDLPTAFSRIVAGYVSTEVVRHVASGLGNLVGRLAYHDFLSMSLETNDVLKLPRCETCGRRGDGRPARQRFVTLDDLAERQRESR